MLSCWQSHLLFLVPASIPAGSGHMGIKQAEQRIKKIRNPPLPRIHGALLSKNIWSSDISEKKHAERQMATK